MFSRRRGSKPTIRTSTWTELFHQMTSGVVHRSLQVITPTKVTEEISLVAETSVKHIPNNSNQDNNKLTVSEDAENKQENSCLEDEPQNSDESFVHLDHECDIKHDILQPVNAILKGLLDDVTEDEALKELASIAVHKTEPKGLNEQPDCKVEVEKQDLEDKISECTKCKSFGHDKSKCETIPSLTITKTDNSENNSNTGLEHSAVNSNNLGSRSASTCKMESPSSNRQSIVNSEGYRKSPATLPKKTYIEDTTKLIKQIKDIKKEVDNIKFELKITEAKKIDRDFIQVVLRGIPPEIKDQDIINDLQLKEFSVNDVYRLTDANGEFTNEVVFKLPKNEDHIFYFSCCLGFVVQVEECKGDFSWVENRPAAFSKVQRSYSEKSINVLFGGIPMEVSENNILRDLKRNNFHPIAVHSMVTTKRYLSGGHQHIVIVQVPQEEAYIYDLACVLGYPITVEAYSKCNYNVARCKKCLQVGHVTGVCPGKETFKKEDITHKECKVNVDTSTINVVIKGVPIEYNDTTVFNELLHDGFTPVAIHRMIVNEEILPTYLVQVPEKEKMIFSLTCFLGFHIKVETFLPDLYHVEQCDNCRQFGHIGEGCPNEKHCIDLSCEVGEQNIDRQESVDLNCIKTKNSEKTESIDNTELLNENILDNTNETENTKEKSVFATPDSPVVTMDSTVSKSAKYQWIRKKIDNAKCRCRCNDNPSVPRQKDVETNTEYTQAKVTEMAEAVGSYKSLSQQFIENVCVFVDVFMNVNEHDVNVCDVMEAYLKFKEISGMTSSFVDAMIRILKSATNIMMDIPNLPGVTLNTINEQLHILEELEEMKRIMDSTPDRFSKEYDIHFPDIL